MKKFFIITFLAIGMSTFAKTGRIVLNDVKNKTTLGCCSVGEFRSCVGDSQDCCRARAQYCKKHSCSDSTITSL